jgi:hypothetical protein
MELIVASLVITSLLLVTHFALLVRGRLLATLRARSGG